MENKENESSEPSTDEIVEEGGGFQLLILPKIESVPAAAKKWKMLTDAGLDPEEMAECLYHYCGGTKEQRRLGLKAARNFRKEIKPAADEIRKAADTTERILGDLEKVGGIKFHVPDFKSLPSIQRDFAAELERLAPILTNNVAQGVRTENNGWLNSRAHGEALSKLVYMVREVTSKPFADIAPLVAAIKGDVDASYSHLADSLRNAFRRQWKETKGRGKSPGQMKLPARKSDA